MKGFDEGFDEWFDEGFCEGFCEWFDAGFCEWFDAGAIFGVSIRMLSLYIIAVFYRVLSQTCIV